MRRKIAFCVTRAGMSALDQARAGSRARRSGTKWVMPLMLLLGLAVAPTSVLAAPITGEAEPELSDVGPGPTSLQDPAALPDEPSTGADADDLVIEFSIMPSASDPSKMETVIIVQQGGGKSVCVTQGASDIISRSYRRRGDLPFNPTTPNEIRGLSSGHSGEFMGFNEFKVFIRPHSAADDFTDTRMLPGRRCGGLLRRRWGGLRPSSAGGRCPLRCRRNFRHELPGDRSCQSDAAVAGHCGPQSASRRITDRHTRRRGDRARTGIAEWRTRGI